MQLNTKVILATTLILAGNGTLKALDIPLGGGGVGGQSAGSASIGYVDMDKIFQIYPQTQAAKEDYAKQLKKKREQLASKEAELTELQGRISVLEATIKQGQPTQPPPAANSPATPFDPNAPATPANPSSSANGGDLLGNVNQSVGNMKTDLDNKKTELLEMRKQAQADLAAFESQQSQLILGKIYQALRDVAVESQVSVVVDKSSILYGDTTIDLTEKLQERVRGY